MTRMLTRPIPEFAVEALKDRRLAIMRTGTGRDMAIDTRMTSDPKWSQKASPWRLAQDAVAAAALEFLATLGYRARLAITTGEYLIVSVDSGVSRPMLNIDEVESDEAASSRAETSLRPMCLSAADASAIERALVSGSARPRIEVAPLPQYEG
jgi:hypothetical protein